MLVVALEMIALPALVLSFWIALRAERRQVARIPIARARRPAAPPSLDRN